MAKCPVCDREMLMADGCGVEELIFKDRRIPRIKVGDDGDFFFGEAPGTRCGDCGAKVGYFHHWGCDCERCPVCGGQLIGCDCDIEIEY